MVSVGSARRTRTNSRCGEFFAVTAVIGGRPAQWDAQDMQSIGIVLDNEFSNRTAPVARAAVAAYRLRPIMRQGTASSIHETWSRFTTPDAARLAAKQMYHDDRVLRVFIVTDGLTPQFVEWVER